MADGGASADGGSCTVELQVFKHPAYVYTVPPARTAAGHRCAQSAGVALRCAERAARAAPRTGT